MTMKAAGSACFYHCRTVPKDSRKNHAVPGRRSRGCTGLLKAGIEELRADCLRWSGMKKSHKDMVKMCKALLEKPGGISGKAIFRECLLTFSKDASYGRLSPYPLLTLLPDRRVSGSVLLHIPAGIRLCSPASPASMAAAFLRELPVQTSDGTGGDL